MSNVTIYHNPKCGTSRNTLALIRHAGIEPNVVLYLETPPTRETIQKMAADAGLTLREAMREKGTPYAEMGLDKPEVSDAQLLDAIEAHPILLNRPFVVTEKGTRLCRPSEVALEILPAMPAKAFAKEDGTPMLDAQGQLIKK
ncbi:arsenate reductase (glutaredoxin) [Pusillimonas sp. NJUB218]|uniref:arsenate reductase (glutaredoxin) n=1 Tax=Pusillimonas sp. NJUB218 TaxID=2023230 RepID=UPI000F4CBC7D|nr:arsenate reductase (glutaredoxin) [Pusillimonas sp. NJUB218]ROT45293.1 arsenate reductase (glutaredoxin) [Pusillimonas sp. NJUB218]